MKKVFFRFLVIIIPLLTISVVCIYGVHKYYNSTKSKNLVAKINQEYKGTPNMNNLEKLDSKMSQDKNFLSSTLNISVAQNEELPNITTINDQQSIQAGYDDLKSRIRDTSNESTVNNLINIIKNFNKGQLLDSDTKSAQVMINVIKYITILDLETKISLGLNCDQQISVLQGLGANDPELLDLVNIVKHKHVLTDIEIKNNYLKTKEKLEYQVYIKDNNPSWVGKLFFKIRKYIGFSKESDVTFLSKTNAMIAKKEYTEISDLLMNYKFEDPEINQFKQDVDQVANFEKTFAGISRTIAIRIANLTQAQ